MNKHEFIEALKNGLSFLSPNELGDVVAEFEEHFEVGVERGYSEQQLVDQLGDPKRIIEAYRTEAIERGGLRIDMDAPRAPHVETDHDQPEPPREEKRSRSGNGGGFNALINIRECHAASAVRNIDVDAIDATVIFSLADADEVRVDVEGMSSYGTTAQLSGDTLVIRQQSGFLRLLNWRNEPDIRVTIPRVYGGSARIATRSGEVRMGGFKGRSLKIQTISGDMQLGDLYADARIQLQSTSGDITTGKCMAESISVHLTSADLRFDALTTLDLSITSVSGDIRQNKGAILEAKKLYVKTVSGDIRVTLNDHWKTLEMNTISGDTKLVLPKDCAPFAVSMSTLSGEVKSQFPNVSGAGRTIYMKSVSGDLKLKQG